MSEATREQVLWFLERMYNSVDDETTCDDIYKVIQLVKGETTKLVVNSPAGGKVSFFNKAYKTVEEYAKSEDVLIIRAADIKPEERVGELREEGYVWR